MPVTRFYSSTAGKMVLQLGVTAVATALSVDTTVGLPGSCPFTLLLDAGTSAEEVVTVTQVSGNTLVVQRGQDGTSAQAHPNGAIIRHALTARDLRESREHEAAPIAHGVASNLVGVNDAQALTNKNLSAATNTFPASLATSAALTTEAAARAAGDTTQATALTAHAALVATHGATGAVVGTTNVQTLTNKTLASPQFTGSAVNPTGSFFVGDPTSPDQHMFFVRRKATSNTDQYEGRYYLTDSTGGTSSAIGHVLVKNGVEIARTQLNANGRFASTGGIDAGGTITADNLDDTGWLGTGFAAASGWTQSSSQYRVKYGIATVNLRFSLSGRSIVIPSNGNVADDNVMTIPVPARSGFVISVGGIVNIAGGGTAGWIGRIESGTLYIMASTNPNLTWPANTGFFGTATYIV